MTGLMLGMRVDWIWYGVDGKSGQPGDGRGVESQVESSRAKTDSSRVK